MVKPSGQAQLLRAAGKLLCQNTLLALTKILKSDALAAKTRADGTGPGGGSGVSRQTAYRLWPETFDAVEAMATDGGATGAIKDYQVAEQTYGAANHLGPGASSKDQKAIFRKVLSQNFIRQFESEGMIVGWVLHVAALTSSPLWRGERPDSDTEAVGQRVLHARGKLAEQVSGNWTKLLTEAMASYGRRPKATLGDDGVKKIVRVMHKLFDGLLLRMFIDPELNEPGISPEERDRRLMRAADEAADVMFDVGWSYTEPGSLQDPRRPTTQDVEDAFGGLVGAAAELYKAGQLAVVTPRAAAKAAKLRVEIATALFPEPGDLVDSVLRWLISPAGVEFSTSEKAMVRSVLGRLNHAARQCPAAFTAAKSLPPTTPQDTKPFLEELTQAMTEWLEQVGCPEPPINAARLIGFACDGENGWPSVTAMLELVGPATP